MAGKVKLPPRQRTILEAHGVIEAPVVPPTEKLAEAISERGGRYELTQSAEGGAFARVWLGARAFDGAGDQPHVALCNAFCPALATLPVQAEMNLGTTGRETPEEEAGEIITVPFFNALALPLGDTVPPNDGDGDAPIDADGSNSGGQPAPAISVGTDRPMSVAETMAMISDANARTIFEIPGEELKQIRDDLAAELNDTTFSDEEWASIRDEIAKIDAELLVRDMPEPAPIDVEASVPPVDSRPLSPLITSAAQAHYATMIPPPSLDDLQERREELLALIGCPDETSVDVETVRYEVQVIEGELAAHGAMPSGATSSIEGMSEREYSIYHQHVGRFRDERIAGKARSAEALQERITDLERRVSKTRMPKNLEVYRAEIRATREEIDRQLAETGAQIADIVAANGASIEAAFGADAFEEVPAPIQAIAVADELMGRAFGGTFVSGQRLPDVPAPVVAPVTPESAEEETYYGDLSKMPSLVLGTCITEMEKEIAGAAPDQDTSPYAREIERIRAELGRRLGDPVARPTNPYVLPEVVAAIARRPARENLERIVQIERQLADPELRSHNGPIWRAEVLACKRAVADEVRSALGLSFDEAEGTFYHATSADVVASAEVLRRFKSHRAGDAQLSLTSDPVLTAAK